MRALFLFILFLSPIAVHAQVQFVYQVSYDAIADTCDVFTDSHTFNMKLEDHYSGRYINFGRTDWRGRQRLRRVEGTPDLFISKFQKRYRVDGADCLQRWHYEVSGFMGDAISVYQYRRWQCEGRRACEFEYLGSGPLLRIKNVKPYRPRR